MYTRKWPLPLYVLCGWDSTYKNPGRDKGERVEESRRGDKKGKEKKDKEIWGRIEQGRT
jgi:hypothetical protein